MDMNPKATAERFRRCKNAGSVFYHKGRRVAEFSPLPIEKQALIEAETILQRAGAGALFSVYSQLAERYKSLIVLLPVSVSMTVTDQAIAQSLQQMQLVVASADKIHCLSWFYGIPAKTAKQHVAEMFNDDAEGTIKDIREMLIYSQHLCQQARAEMQQYQNSERYRDTLAQIAILKKYIYYPESMNSFEQDIKLNIPNGGADLLSVEDERIYNYITSAYAKHIAASEGAYNEHQAWRRELLLTLGDDSAGDAGGVNITMGR